MTDSIQFWAVGWPDHETTQLWWCKTQSAPPIGSIPQCQAAVIRSICSLFSIWFCYSYNWYMVHMSWVVINWLISRYVRTRAPPSRTRMCASPRGVCELGDLDPTQGGAFQHDTNILISKGVPTGQTGISAIPAWVEAGKWSVGVNPIDKRRLG